jgi:hypothetical protein
MGETCNTHGKFKLSHPVSWTLNLRRYLKSITFRSEESDKINSEDIVCQVVGRDYEALSRSRIEHL